MSGQIKIELQDTFGSDRVIAEAAWTSSTDRNKAVAKTDEQVSKLVRQLAEEGHGVPFEHVCMRFWISLPVAIDRQLVKHRISSHSGASGRYRTMPNRYLDVPEDIFDTMVAAGLGPATQRYVEVCEVANHTYQTIVADLKTAEREQRLSNAQLKRCREFFRGMLPQHNMTETVWTVNLRSFANFMKLRDKPNAQPEIQFIAKEMHRLIKAVGFCPVAVQTLEQKGWVI